MTKRQWKNIFRPEFVNRFDATVIFHPLTKDNLMKIAQLSFQSLQKNLKEKDIDFVITEPLKEKIVELSYKPEFGAREMRRVIQDKVENAVASALLSDKIKLRYMPEITFKVDDTYERTKGIFDLMNRLKKEKKDEERNSGDKKI